MSTQPAGSELVGKTCPYCQSTIKPGVQVTLCDACGIPHHTECWQANGGCTTFGCTGSPGRASSSPPQTPVRPGVCPVCGYAVDPFDVSCRRCEELRRIGVAPGTPAQPGGAHAVPGQPVAGYQPLPYPTGAFDQVPAGVKGWNWGAFAITPIWCGAMNRWGWFWASLVLNCLCGIGGLAVAIYLGISGNDLAWQSRHWHSVEHFRETQAVWNKWGIGLFVLWVFVFFIYLIGVIAETSTGYY